MKSITKILSNMLLNECMGPSAITYQLEHVYQLPVSSAFKVTLGYVLCY